MLTYVHTLGAPTFASVANRFARKEEIEGDPPRGSPLRLSPPHMPDGVRDFVTNPTRAGTQNILAANRARDHEDVHEDHTTWTIFDDIVWRLHPLRCSWN